MLFFYIIFNSFIQAIFMEGEYSGASLTNFLMSFNLVIFSFNKVN